MVVLLFAMLVGRYPFFKILFWGLPYQTGPRLLNVLFLHTFFHPFSHLFHISSVCYFILRPLHLRVCGCPTHGSALSQRCEDTFGSGLCASEGSRFPCFSCCSQCGRSCHCSCPLFRSDAVTLPPLSFVAFSLCHEHALTSILWCTDKSQV